MSDSQNRNPSAKMVSYGFPSNTKSGSTIWSNSLANIGKTESSSFATACSDNHHSLERGSATHRFMSECLVSTSENKAGHHQRRPQAETDIHLAWARAQPKHPPNYRPFCNMVDISLLFWRGGIMSTNHLRGCSDSPNSYPQSTMKPTRAPMSHTSPAPSHGPYQPKASGICGSPAGHAL